MTNQELRCIECPGTLRIKRELASVLSCDSCSAVFAPQGALARLFGTDEDLRQQFNPSSPLLERRCPSCAQNMRTAHYSNLEPQIELDQCPACLGLSLDQDQLQGLIEVNARIRRLFGDGTFEPTPNKGGSFTSWLRRLWPF